MQLNEFSKLKIIHIPGKNVTVAGMLSRSFSKTELQPTQLKHKQVPPQIDLAIIHLHLHITQLNTKFHFIKNTIPILFLLTMQHYYLTTNI